MGEPVRSDLWCNVGGRSLPCWIYDELPQQMRPASGADLFFGRPVLYRLRLGAGAGKYTSDYVTERNIRQLRRMIEDGVPVWVRDK